MIDRLPMKSESDAKSCAIDATKTVARDRRIATGIEMYEYTPASTDIPRAALYSKQRRTRKNKKKKNPYES